MTVILALFAILAIGFSRQAIFIKKLEKELELSNDYLENFLAWCNGGGKDQALYNWMLHHADEMQFLLGGGGQIFYRAAGASFAHTKYSVILNQIPELQREFFDPINNLYGRLERNTMHGIQMVEGCLRRHIGSEEGILFGERKKLSNPISLFVSGISAVLEVPLYLLSQFHLLPDWKRGRVVRGKIFSVLAGMVSLVSFVSGIVTIVLGWEPFFGMIKGFFRKS